MNADPPERSPLPRDPEAMRRWFAEANPLLYRHLALYQQVLRQVLPGSVDQAVFHLATQIHPGRYAALSDERRLRLHQRLASLVQRCTTLLTVEQLSSLAARLHRQRLNRRRLRQRQLLQRLIRANPQMDPQQSAAPEPAGSVEPDPEAFLRPHAAAAAEPPMMLPPGSVSLAFDLPLRGDRLGWGEESPAPDHSGHAERGAPAFSAMEDDDAFDGEEETDDDPGHWPALAEGPGLLPRDPLQLEAWLLSYDAALDRRLRNLSHAINVELLHASLLPLLLPASLLDAVLEGRVETLGAPPNLLCLPLPMALPGLESPVQANVLLLRPADLELENPPLRRVRRQLQQQRLESRRMAQHHRRLERRLQAREAEALWLQDIRTRRQDPPPPRS